MKKPLFIIGAMILFALNSVAQTHRTCPSHLIMEKQNANTQIKEQRLQIEERTK